MRCKGFCQIPGNSINFDYILMIYYRFRFAQNARSLSLMINDKMITNQDMALYWIRRIGSKKPFPYLNQAKKLNFFQYHCLDVISFLILIPIIFATCIVWIAFRVALLIKKLKTNKKIQ